MAKKILLGLVVAVLIPGLVAAASEIEGDLGTGLDTGIDAGVIVVPTANPGTGSYASAQTVTLTAAGSSAICYSTVGNPVCAYSGVACTTGTVYAAAIGINITTTLRAISCYPNGNNSAIATFTYTISGTPPGGGSPGGSGPTSPSKPSTTNGTVIASASLGGETSLNNPDGGSAGLDIPASAISISTSFTIEIVDEDEVPEIPTGLFMIAGQVYQFTATAGGESVTEFDSSLTITFTYTDEQLGDMDEGSLQIYYYDSGLGTWVPLDTTINLGANTATVTIDHFTFFALIGEILPEGCTCTAWEDDECAGGDCEDEEMCQTRVCEPSACADETRCIEDESCAVGAMTPEELEARIKEILTLIALLKLKIAELTGGLDAIPASFSFQTDLEKEMTGSDVKYLQIVLNSDTATQVAGSGVGSPGNETNYFGSLTETAVIKFQEKYFDDVLAPWGFTSGTGYVGKTTRAKLNKILGR